MDWTHDVAAIPVSDVDPEFVRLGFGNVRERQHFSHPGDPCAGAVLRVASPFLPPFGPYNPLRHTHDLGFSPIPFAGRRRSSIPVSQ